MKRPRTPEAAKADLDHLWGEIFTAAGNIIKISKKHPVDKIHAHAATAIIELAVLVVIPKGGERK